MPEITISLWWFVIPFGLLLVVIGIPLGVAVVCDQIRTFGWRGIFVMAPAFAGSFIATGIGHATRFGLDFGDVVLITLGCALAVAWPLTVRRGPVPASTQAPSRSVSKEAG